MTAPPDVVSDATAAELLADDKFCDRMAEAFCDKYDRLRRDLRTMLRIPASEYVSTAELTARVGLVLQAAWAVGDLVAAKAKADEVVGFDAEHVDGLIGREGR